MSEYRNQLERFLSELDVEANTVLDIGGAQNPVEGRTKSWNVREYHILDLPEWDIEEQGPHGFPSWSIVDLDGDIAFCLEVFEYVVNPIQAITNVHRSLRKGGLAYITFPFVYPHHNELERDFLRYTEPGVRRLAEEAGLKITNIWYRTDKSGLLREFYKADGMKMAKEYHNHDVTGFICEMRKQ